MITPQILREHVETDLDPSALQRLINDAVADIEARYGTTAARTRTMATTGRERRLWLTTPAASVTAILEGRTIQPDTAVESSAYELSHEGLAIDRIDGGSWQRYVKVTVTPKDDQARRDRVTIDLVRLALQYNALGSETSGDYSAQAVQYQAERETLLRGLMAGRLPLA
jgi:hypothetical protein